MYIFTLSEVKQIYVARGSKTTVTFIDKLIEMFGPDAKLTTTENMYVRK